MTHVFPQPEQIKISDDYCVQGRDIGGLSKRELFAAMAMQGLLSNGNLKEEIKFVPTAIKMADALIEALAK